MGFCANKPKFQSTHPHGVRRSFCRLYKKSNCFNPRTRTGCDNGTMTKEQVNTLFQSTHPHGVRQGFPITPYGGIIGFNPRTRTGCDLRHGTTKTRNRPFQSTHPHGVRPVIGVVNPQSVGFQSTHPHGVRLGLCAIERRDDSFNPRTRTGCDVP